MQSDSFDISFMMSFRFVVDFIVFHYLYFIHNRNITLSYCCCLKTKELREAKYIHIIIIFFLKLKENGCQYCFLLRPSITRYVTFTPGAILKTCYHGHHPASVQTEPNYPNHRLESIMAFIICHNHYHVSLFIMIMEWYPKDLNDFFNDLKWQCSIFNLLNHAEVFRAYVSAFYEHIFSKIVFN